MEFFLFYQERYDKTKFILVTMLFCVACNDSADQWWCSHKTEDNIFTRFIAQVFHLFLKCGILRLSMCNHKNDHPHKINKTLINVNWKVLLWHFLLLWSTLLLCVWFQLLMNVLAYHFSAKTFYFIYIYRYRLKCDCESANVTMNIQLNLENSAVEWERVRVFQSSHMNFKIYTLNVFTGNSERNKW